MQVDVCTEVTPELVSAMAELIPQLSSSSPAPSAEVLSGIIDHDACHLLVATEDGTFLGSMTLVVFPIPTGVRAWIEDVVVDEAARGKGVGATTARAVTPLRLSIDRNGSQPRALEPGGKRTAIQSP